jgi:hypothetical protein
MIEAKGKDADKVWLLLDYICELRVDATGRLVSRIGVAGWAQMCAAAVLCCADSRSSVPVGEGAQCCLSWPVSVADSMYGHSPPPLLLPLPSAVAAAAAACADL